MSRTDKKFQFVPGSTGNTLFRTVGARPTENSISGGKKVSRRSSSVTSPRRCRPTSRDGSAATLLWSDGQLSVQELAQDYRFPVLARVVKGYDVNGLKLSTGQVLHIHGVCSVQRRLSATNSHGRMISLPLDFPIAVQIATSSGADDVMTLSEAVSRYQLPLTVHCTSLATDQHPQPTELDGQQLTISHLYNCHFLLANPIRSGWLDASDVVLVPDDLGAMMSVAAGMEGTSEEEWNDYRGMFARSSRAVRLAGFSAYTGFYYTSDCHRRSTESSVVSLPSSAAASRADDVSHLDVKPYIITRRDNARRRPQIPLDQRQAHRLSHQPSAVTQSLDSLETLGRAAGDARQHPFQRDIDVHCRRSEKARLQAMPLSVVASRDHHAGRRRSSAVAETSFSECPPPGRRQSHHDIGVQACLPPPSRTSSSGQPVQCQPRMGRRSRLTTSGALVVHRKSNSDNFVDSTEDLSGSRIGGSMPCLQGDELEVTDSRGDVSSASRVSTATQVLSPPSPVAGRTPSVSVVGGAKTRRSLQNVQQDDEGYLTKESNTSTSSVDTFRHSPVFF